MQRPFGRQLPILGLALGLTLAAVSTAGCSLNPRVRKQRYLENARRYEQQGKLKEAAGQLSNALRIDHGFAAAHYELGQTYLKMGRTGDAYNEMITTVELDPRNLTAKLSLARMQLAAGIPDQAQQLVNEVVKANPRNADAFALSSNIAAQQREFNLAIARIQQAVAIDPGRSEFHTTLAQLEARDPDQHEEAQKEFQRAVALDFSNAPAHLALGRFFEQKKDYPNAIRETLAAVQAAPKDLAARLELAGLYLASGDVARAEQTLRAASSELSGTVEGASALSDFYLARGEAGAAESAYAELLAARPKSFELRFAYARILAIEHKDAEATGIAKQLSRENPDAPEVAVLNASLLVNANKIPAAYDLLNRARTSSPDNVLLLIAYARVAVMQGDEVEAEVSLRKASQVAPNSLDVEVGLAELADHKHDFRLLAQVAETTLEKNPSYPSAYLWRATAEAGEKDYAKAEADFRVVLSRQPNDGNALSELGQVLILENRAPAGLAMLERALEADPDNALALDRIVQYDLGARQPDKALARINQAIAMQPKNASFLDELAMVDIQTKAYAAARDTAKKASGLAPNDRSAVQYVAQAQSALGDKDKAIVAWQMWVAKHPGDGKAVSEIGQLQQDKGDTGNAMDSYRKALYLDPRQVLASRNLAFLLVESGQDLDLALRYAQDARSGLPEAASTADTLGWVYYARGRYLLARDLLEEAAREDPASADIHYHLGMTYKKLGDKINAALNLKRATLLAPNTDTARLANAALSRPG